MKDNKELENRILEYQDCVDFLRELDSLLNKYMKKSVIIKLSLDNRSEIILRKKKG